MGDRKYQTLLVGFKDVDVLRIVATLSSLDIDFHRAPWMEGLSTFLTRRPFDAVVLLYPTEADLSQFVASLRAEGGPNRRTGVVLLAETGAMDRARQHLGEGVNRVVSITDRGDTLKDSLLSLLSVAPRYRLRLPMELAAQVDDNPVKAFCNTENISSTGMLVSCATTLPVGVPIDFSISPPGENNPIRGLAKVARATDPNREHVLGLGASFISFLADHQARLLSLLPQKQP